MPVDQEHWLRRLWRATVASRSRRRLLSTTLSNYGHGLILVAVLQSMSEGYQLEVWETFLELAGAIVLYGLAFTAVPDGPA